MVETTDEAGKGIKEPFPFGVRQAGQFLEVFRIKGTGAIPQALKGMFTSEDIVKQLIIKYYRDLIKKETTRPDGRPKFKPRDPRGRKSRRKINGSSETDSTV